MFELIGMAVVACLVVPLWMFVWHFLRACFWPTREMKEAMLRAREEEERRNELLRQSAWQCERRKDRVRQWDWSASSSLTEAERAELERGR